MPELFDTIDKVRRETEEFGRGGNSSFSKVLPTLQIAIDSTSLKAMKKCWRYYYYSIVRGYALEGENIHFVFGIWFHSATELYDHLRIGNPDWRFYRKLRNFGISETTARKAVRSGLSHEEALLCTIRFALIATWNFETKRPHNSLEPTKNRQTLLQTLVRYLDKFQNDPMQTVRLQNGKAAVELSFKFALNELDEDGTFVAPTGEDYLLCGHFDKLALWNGELFVPDKKTSKYELDDTYFLQYTPDIQVSVYSIAGRVITKQDVQGVVIDGTQLLVGGSRFRRKDIPRSEAQLETFLLDLKFYLHTAYLCAVNDHWPMNEEACGWGKMMCQFRPVCSTEPAGQEDVLKNFYVKRIWDPMIAR